jgi:hypothetical protein
MEAKINIAEILKDKPQGTKLYSSACGKCTLEEADDKSFKISFYNSKFGFMNVGEGYLDKNGKLYDDGECVVFPSKEMRDWSKFAWKKGDVLVSNDSDSHIIFKGFSKDDYTTFEGKHWISVSKKRHISCLGTQNTQNYHIEDNKEVAQTYINTIEEKLGGKLNLETLEIEKQSEFKDGDIVCISGMGYLAYGIVKSIDYSSKKLEYYVLNDMSILKFGDWLSFEDKHIQPITETQQIILFEDLSKDGKAWDAEKKAVVDLKPKWTPKPFDRVITRLSDDAIWTANIFSHIDRHGKYVTIGCISGYHHCIPYNEETAKLIGTTKDVEV